MQREGSHPRCEVTDKLLSMLDVLVDGRFVEELKDISLRFRGSSNQRLIDMKKTLAAGKIVLLPDLDRKSADRRRHNITAESKTNASRHKEEIPWLLWHSGLKNCGQRRP